MLRLHLAEKELNLVVGMGGCVLTLPRHGCQNVYRDHDRIDGFEGIPAFDAHVKPQIVAARCFYPADVRRKIFWTGHFQHRQRVVASRHAHGRIPIPLPDGTLIHNNSQKQTKVAHLTILSLCIAHDGINPSVSRYGTRAHASALRQYRNIVRRSSLIEFSQLPVHPDQQRKGCGKDGDTDHNPSHVLFPPVRSSRARRAVAAVNAFRLPLTLCTDARGFGRCHLGRMDNSSRMSIRPLSCAGVRA